MLSHVNSTTGLNYLCYKKIISSLTLIILILFAGSAIAQQTSASSLPTLAGAKALINGTNGGEITISELNEATISIDIPGYNITSFTVTLNVGDDLCNVVQTEGNTLNKRQTTLVDKQNAGDKVYVEDIVCKNQQGQEFTVSSITLKIKN